MREEEVMRYPLAAGLAIIVPSHHPAQTVRVDRGPGIRRVYAFFGFWIALAAMAAFPTSAARGGESIWTHNGSTIRWVSSGEDRWMYYLQPRLGLAAIGVQPGTLLFQGQRIGNILSGVAFVFSENCPPAPYRVEGLIYSETDVRLDGAVPVIDPDSCRIVDFTWDSHNAALRFHYLITIDRAPVVAQGRNCTVDDPTGTPLNVRANPNGPILGALYNGTSVEIRDITVDGSGHRWAYIVPLTKGKRGWVFRAFLDCE